MKKYRYHYVIKHKNKYTTDLFGCVQDKFMLDVAMSKLNRNDFVIEKKRITNEDFNLRYN